MDVENKVIKLLIDEKNIANEILTLFEEALDDEDKVVIELTIDGRKIICKDDNFFSALTILRKELEKNNIQILCNGSAENVFPSSMQLSMGYGRNAYKLLIGKQATNKDVVDIFECDENLKFVSINKQEEFYDKWVKSIMN